MIEFLGDGQAAIALSGEIDMSTVGGVHSEVAAALEAAPTALVLRMQDVTFIDSTGLGALIAARNACREKGVPLVLDRPSLQVRRVLSLTGLDALFMTQQPSTSKRPSGPGDR